MVENEGELTAVAAARGWLTRAVDMGDLPLARQVCGGMRLTSSTPFVCFLLLTPFHPF